MWSVIQYTMNKANFDVWFDPSRWKEKDNYIIITILIFFLIWHELNNRVRDKKLQEYQAKHIACTSHSALVVSTQCNNVCCVAVLLTDCDGYYLSPEKSRISQSNINNVCDKTSSYSWMSRRIEKIPTV